MPVRKKTATCPCCNVEINDNFIDHKSSALHLFNFYMWAYDKKRKALAKDKDGIRLEVTPLNANNSELQLNYNNNRGKYSLEIKPSQLQSLNNTLEFRCSLYNDRKDDDMFLTAARTLDASELSSCYDDKEDWMQSNKFIQIKPKEKYKGVIVKFHVENIVVGSFKIPFALNLQTENGETAVTLCRTILVTIVDWEEKQEISVTKHSSPFTDQPWDTDVTIVTPVKRLRLLNNYPLPPEHARFFKHGLREWKEMKPKDIETLQFIKKQMEPGHLTKENYAKFLHYCLWLEECISILMLRRYNMENVTLKNHGKHDMKLEVPGLAEKRPSLIAGDRICIRVHEDHTGYEGYIRTVEDRHIVIQYIDQELIDMVYSCPDTEMDVAFQLGRLPLERSHQGIDNVCAKGILHSLFPDSLHLRPYVQMYKLQDKDYRNQNIVRNLEQKTAVEKILNCSSQGAPYIVFGPPGTGKTVTIVEAICQILKKTNKKILVCAPANAACDMLASKLIPYCTKAELIRVHSETRDRSTITKAVQNYSNMTSRGEFLPVAGRDMGKYRIVVTTLIFIGKFSDCYKPDCVFIDEAAQALEPDACVALGMLKQEGTIVLAGDPMQLGPIVQSTVAQKYGLSISLLERLMNTQETYKNENPNFITMLKKNFRSHPDILDIPNKLFYGTKLEAVSNAPLNDPVSKLAVYPNISTLHPSRNMAKGLIGMGQALEFCAVSAKERREGQSPSYFNPAEANMVIQYIKTLVGVSLGPNSQVKPSDIGVITPYIRQVYKIKGLLQDNNFKEVEVGSTEAFQGREKRIIIISTVRAQHDLLKLDKSYALGFVKQEKRFNVALTRAISKLIVIGCPTVLATDEKWRNYMQQCRNLDSYHGAPFEDRTKEKMSEIVERFSSFPKFAAA